MIYIYRERFPRFFRWGNSWKKLFVKSSSMVLMKGDSHVVGLLSLDRFSFMYKILSTKNTGGVADVP